MALKSNNIHWIRTRSQPYYNKRIRYIIIPFVTLKPIHSGDLNGKIEKFIESKNILRFVKIM